MLKTPVFYVELKSLISNFNVSQFHHSHWFYEHFQGMVEKWDPVLGPQDPGT